MVKGSHVCGGLLLLCSSLVFSMAPAPAPVVSKDLPMEKPVNWQSFEKYAGKIIAIKSNDKYFAPYQGCPAYAYVSKGPSTYTLIADDGTQAPFLSYCMFRMLKAGDWGRTCVLGDAELQDDPSFMVRKALPEEIALLRVLVEHADIQFDCNCTHDEKQEALDLLSEQV